MPSPPTLHVDTLEQQQLPEGWRYKVRYLSEDSSTIFHTPKDFIEAYLFVPFHEPGKQLPAIVAIHQDGPHDYLGKLEPAGLMGDQEQYYGLELFQRGYIVICPDRFYHSIRRRVARPDTLADSEDGTKALEHWAGQLLSTGRTTMGKQVYDLERTVDVLYANPSVDRERIGAIGHSAGGNALAYFMFADTRVKLGVSSCGVFELADWFDEQAPMKRYAFSVIPNFINQARTSDFVGQIAPRPFLVTRGLNEWGNNNEKRRLQSLQHVQSTEKLIAEAQFYYQKKNAKEQLQAIYFSDGKGYHAFPSAVKTRVYDWIDQHLKPAQPVTRNR